MKARTDKGDLVRLLDIDSEFIIELKYATNDNFTKKRIYSSNECYINKNTAKLLIKAKNIFKSDGYRVKIWDAYRPISAQENFWKILPDDQFVARPPDMDNIKLRPTHLNGLCIDITLTDLNGKNIPMPSEFDDFSGKASILFKDIPSDIRKNAIYLRNVMESVGFKGYDSEWWHFYDITTNPVPFMNFQI